MLCGDNQSSRWSRRSATAGRPRERRPAGKQQSRSRRRSTFDRFCATDLRLQKDGRRRQALRRRAGQPGTAIRCAPSRSDPPRQRPESPLSASSLPTSARCGSTDRPPSTIAGPSGRGPPTGRINTIRPFRSRIALQLARANLGSEWSFRVFAKMRATVLEDLASQIRIRKDLVMPRFDLHRQAFDVLGSKQVLAAVCIEAHADRGGPTFGGGHCHHVLDSALETTGPNSASFRTGPIER